MTHRQMIRILDALIIVAVFVLIVFAAWLGTTITSHGQTTTDTRTYYDSAGRFSGQSFTHGNSQSFSDGQGRFSGSAIRNSDGSTTYYDRNGRFSGSSNRRPRQ